MESFPGGGSYRPAQLRASEELVDRGPSALHAGQAFLVFVFLVRVPLVEGLLGVRPRLPPLALGGGREKERRGEEKRGRENERTERETERE